MIFDDPIARNFNDTMSTPIIMSIPSTHIPVEIGGDVVTTNQARHRRWFCTGFEGAGALDFYTATCGALGLCTSTSFDGAVLDYYNKITATTVDEYFRGCKVVMCPERCPTTNRWHVHACVLAPNVMSRRQLQTIFGFWDFRPMRGQPAQARDYAIKNGGMVAYVGDPQVWDTADAIRQTAIPIDWSYVITCCNAVRNFKQFKRAYIDTGDEMCTRAAIARCSFIKELIAANSPPKRVINHLLTLWQRSIITACLDSPVASHRKIWWIWSAESATGKSSLVDLLIQHSLKVFIYPQDSSFKDAIHMYDDQPVTVFDVPREGRLDGLYTVLEQISDQNLVSAGKYFGACKRFFCHTVVLSNFAPEHERLPGRISEVKIKPLADETYEQVDIATQLSFD